MPRKRRFNLVGVPQHVIQRARDQELCFCSQADYLQYLNDLKLTTVKYDCRVHAYVLMKNHVHLLITPMQDHGVSHVMQTLGQRYVTYFNKTHQRKGGLWGGRFKSCLVDSDKYLLDCMRYIELNPVRAGLVKAPEDYRWSSYHVNTRRHLDGLLQRHPGFSGLATDEQECHIAYRELFKDPVTGITLHDIREALNQELIYGRPEFKEKIETITQRQVRPGKPGRPSVEELEINYKVGYFLC